MKKIAILLTAIIIVNLSASAQLLWKVKAPGSDKISYILGTHHLAPVAVLDSIAGFNDALLAVDAVYGEVDMQTMSSPSVQQYMMQTIMAPADSTLDKVLSPEQIQSINNYLKKNSLDAMISVAMFNAMRPAMLSNTIALATMSKAVPGFNPATQLDHTVQNRAREKGKEVKGLETAEFQIDALFGTSIESQVKALMRTIESSKDPVGQAIQLTALYRGGDLDGLYKFMTDADDGMTEEETEALITKRNDAWVNFLIGMLPTTTMMIVVGAGHLPGAKGLINQLRNNGFEVTPA